MVQDGRCDYVNLHWYYVNQLAWPAIQAAAEQDMGGFIISPTDKGGKLYEPSDKLVRLCDPLSPIVFNDLLLPAQRSLPRSTRFQQSAAARPSDFDEHMKALPLLDRRGRARRPRWRRSCAGSTKSSSGCSAARGSTCASALPDWEAVPGHVNIREILRLRTTSPARST